MQAACTDGLVWGKGVDGLDVHVAVHCGHVQDVCRALAIFIQKECGDYRVIDGYAMVVVFV